ncbi:Nitrilase/cyanide hydratase and apolipoprotein N-acyltransferase [Pseudopedobacter saltans DSM 12145]|uniref:Omega-amidase YafV n=1 Tax=Pseudopedobacter saltans (strain ATCC 51119 / DSM 12145 / JCM 21818 / CCUG 39354 / LMG 10337 / NBRC 100064 / NCIMB 13643) TaxID=762903 RepID=F0SC92_PSESL|nr:nitrilase family protein [Pseudopedobacter saltans]ADY51689.1 Nitrilase/cyanide hydratase and apolipoprotein N-acyltransferase [Pseudopedobacter saltans DSM 12145]
MNPLKISTFQAYLFWENIEKNLQNLELKLSGLREKTDLIVLPEMFNTGFTMNAAELAEDMNGKTVNWMKRIAAKHKAVVTGSLIIKEDGNFYNRLVWMKPDGNFEIYNKRHLFGFAHEDKTFTSGNEQKTVELNGWKIRLAICYDLRFPVFLRNKNPEYDLLLLVASWPDSRSSHWRSLIQARAIENQSFVIGVNRVGHDGNQVYHSGHSMCINPLGETVYYKPEDEDLYTFSINYEDLLKARKYFPFLKDADDFELKLK